MKRRTKLLAAAVSMMSVVTSCSNEAVESEVAGSTMLEAEISGIANTRAAIEGTTLPEGSTYGLYVFEDYRAVSGNIKMEANSTATGYELTAGKEVMVVAYYPYAEEAIEFEDMVDIYPGSTDYLHTIDSEVYTKSYNKASIKLYHALARVKFNVTAASDATTSFKVSLNGIERVYTKGSMRLGIVGEGVYGHSNAIDIVKLDNPLNDEIKAGITISTEVLLLPQYIKEMTPYFFFTVDGEAKGISEDIVNATSSGQWESGKVYTYNITISEGAKVSISSATIEEWGEAEELEGVTAELHDRTNGHEYVDLGLPSGTLWATCNVGAKSPEDFGDYYSWGETETKERFYSSDYKWYDESTRKYTKYVLNEEYGKVDGIEELLPEDDVAHVKWGGDWRMPTIAELNELINNADWTIEKINGVSGYLVVSKKNKNSIFLPFAGYDNQREAGWVGNYWSKSVTDYHGAFFLSLMVDDTPRTTGTYRWSGYSVRPVLNK